MEIGKTVSHALGSGKIIALEYHDGVAWIVADLDGYGTHIALETEFAEVV